MCFCTRTFRVCTAAALAWLPVPFQKTPKISEFWVEVFWGGSATDNDSGGTEQPTKDFELHMDNSGVGVHGVGGRGIL